MGGGAWPFLVRGVICLVNSDNERDSNILNRCFQDYDVETCIAFFHAYILNVQVFECVYMSGVVPVGLSHYKDTSFLNGQIASSSNEIEQ